MTQAFNLALFANNVNTAGLLNAAAGLYNPVPVANGGLALSAIAARSIPLANSANTYTTLTPAASQSIRINAANTAWEAFTPGTTLSVNGNSGTSGAVTGVLVNGTAVASTSGTAINFLSIPAWVKRITVMFNGVSTNGSDIVLVQLGTSGGFVTSGYLGAASVVGVSSTAQTTGFGTSGTGTPIAIAYGNVTLCNLTGNTWVMSFSGARSDSAYTLVGGGSVSLSAILDRVRITTVGGTDTFDAGSINIQYE